MKIKPNVIADPWKIIIPTIEHNQISESLCSLGNGIIGQRGNFEEHFSNAHDTLLGNYVAGVYYPDRTRVGWWKNGYPRYYAKVLNATNWIGIDIYVNGNRLDLAKMKIHSFERCLDMQKAYLGRKFEAEFENGNRIKVEARRFLSTVDSEVGHIEYSITPVNFSGTLTISPYLDGDISNQDSNYNEKFWEEVYAEVLEREAYLTTKTKKTEFDVPVFDVTCGMIFDILQDGTKVTQFKELHKIRQTKYVANTVILDVKEGQKITIYKCCAILSDMKGRIGRKLQESIEEGI
jgi:maltose phosphorylase